MAIIHEEPEFLVYSRRDPAGREIKTGGIDALVVPVILGLCAANPIKLEDCVNNLMYSNSRGLPDTEKTQQIKRALISSLPRIAYSSKGGGFKVKDCNEEILSYRFCSGAAQRELVAQRDIIPHISEEDYIARDRACKMYAFFTGIGMSSMLTQAVRDGRLHRFREVGIPPGMDYHVQLYLLAEVNRLKAASYV